MQTSVDVLYVSEDADLRNRIATSLQERDPSFNVRTAGTMSDAMDRHAERPADCVVSGMRLPNGTGLDFQRRLRERFSGVPFILYTLECSREVIRRAVEAGVAEFVPRHPEGDTQELLADQISRVVTEQSAEAAAAEARRINAVVRNLHRMLVRASTREEIDRGVCEIIHQSDPYMFAWIGEHNADKKTVEPRAAAGISKGYLDDVTITTGTGETGQGPTGKAVRTREAQFMQNILENPRYEPWRDQARERGYRSSAAIPLVHKDTLYGVLNVYADRVDAFDETERELLVDIGDDIAFAYHDIELQGEARRFRHAVEQAADAIFITDVEGTIEYVNPKFESLTGYTRSEAIGRKPRILESGEEDETVYAEVWETVHDGEVWEGEIVNARKSGKCYEAEQTVAPFTDETGEVEGFIAVQRDISARKAAEEVIRTVREVNRRLVKAEERESTVSDVTDILSDHRPFGCTFLALLDDEQVEFVCGSASSLTQEQVRDFHTEEYVNKVLDQGLIQIEDVTEPPHQHHIGDEPPHCGVALAIRHGTSTYGILTIHFQPTESPAKQELDLLDELAGDIGYTLHSLQVATALEEREEQYEAVVENIHDALVVVQDGVIKYANSRVREFAYSPAELVGKPLTTFVVSDDQQMVMERYRERLEGEPPEETYKIDIVSGSGEHIPVELSVGVFDYEGKPATITAIRDISEREKRTQQLRVLDRILRHNLHNDMTVVQGYAQMIEEEADDDIAADAAKITKKSEHLLQTVDKEREIVELLSDPPELTEVDVVDVVRRIAETTRDTHSDATIRLDLPDAAPATATVELERALGELLENGIIHNDRTQPEIDVEVEQRAETIRIVIADNGPGIPDEEVKVLTREHELEPLYHGSGLGLWLVKWIITRSGGRLRFTEREPRGSRVLVDLPAAGHSGD